MRVVDLYAAFVNPLDSQEIPSNLFPEFSVGIDPMAILALDYEAKKTDRPVVAISDRVEVGTMNVDRGSTQESCDPFQHGTPGTVADSYDDPAVVRVRCFLLDRGIRSIRARDRATELPVIAHAKRP